MNAFYEFFKAPRVGEVYNIGGARASNTSVIEAIALSEEIAGHELTTIYTDESRIGDHLWWISSNALFESHYPGWSLTYDIPRILSEIYEENGDRWTPERPALRSAPHARHELTGS